LPLLPSADEAARQARLAADLADGVQVADPLNAELFALAPQSVALAGLKRLTLGSDQLSSHLAWLERCPLAEGDLTFSA
jgi:hypothetical protein